MKGKRIGTCFMMGGLLLLAAALCLIIYNVKEQVQAARAANHILQQMETEHKPEEEELPEYIRNPQMEMPETLIDGQAYIGVLSVPALDMQLPVMSKWSYSRLKIAPCRYRGSAYLDDFIIMAHNYRTHFGALANLRPEDEVYFEDVKGNVFCYKVVEMETLGEASGEDLISGDWDLTLFTCTMSGESRVTVRCQRDGK